MVSTRSRRAAEEKENLPAGKKAKRLIPSSVKASPPKPLRFRGRYLLCNEPEQVEAACRALLKGGVRQVGFDMEWRVFFRKGPSNLGRTALLQLGFTAPPGGLDAGLSKLPWTFLDEKVKCKSRFVRESPPLSLSLSPPSSPTMLSDLRCFFAYFWTSAAEMEGNTCASCCTYTTRASHRAWRRSWRARRSRSTA